MSNETSSTDRKPYQKVEYLTLSQLRKDYFLTPAWLDRLGYPDRVYPNPHYRRGAKMRLWTKARVLEFLEKNAEEYLKRRTDAEKRSKISSAIAEAKAKESLEWAKSVEIKMLTLPKDLYKTCKSHLECREIYGPVKNRNIINMIRHQYTNYEKLLDQLFKRTGKYEAYLTIKARINNMIIEKTGIPFDEEYYKEKISA